VAVHRTLSTPSSLTTAPPADPTRPDTVNGRKAGRRETTAESGDVKRAHDLKAQGLKPADIGKIIRTSRATVYRYLAMGTD